MALMQAGYLESGITESVKIRRDEALAKGTVRWLPLKKQIAGAIAPSMLRPPTRYDVIDRLVAHPHAEQAVRRSPAVAAGGLESRADLLRGAAAADRKDSAASAAMAIDPSWDNFTNKLIPVRRVDRLVVWNTS